MKMGLFGAMLVCLFAYPMMSQPALGQAPIELSYNMFLPAAYPHVTAANAWGKEIEKRTGGRIKVVVYPGAVLTTPEKVYDGVVSGISDIGFAFLTYTRGRFPLMEATDLPLGITSGRMGTLVANEFYRKFQPKELSDTKVLLFHGNPPAYIHTKKKPVRTLEDLKGLKIRSTGLSSKIIKALGGTPVAMAMSDVYEGLQRGIIDGAYSPVSTLKAYRHAEVTKYTTDASAVSFTSAGFCVMNLNRWNSLPKDIQKIIEDVSHEYEPVYGKMWDDQGEEGMAFAESKGHTFVSLTKEEGKRWREAAKPVIDDYVKEAEAKGLPGKEALAEVMRLVEKYSK